jgi:hypothetical protein
MLRPPSGSPGPTFCLLRLFGKGLRSSLTLGIGLVVVRRHSCSLGIGNLGSSLSSLLFCGAGLLLAAAGVISGGLRLQLGLGFEHPLMAHGLVFGSIGLDLGAVEGHVAQAHQARLLAQPQHLHKQARQCIEMNEAEITDPAVIRLLVAGEHPEGGILPAGPLDPPGGGDADAVGVEQQHHHHPRLIGLDPAWIPRLVDRIDRRAVQLRSQIEQEKHTRWFAGSHSTGEGGNNVCSGFQERKV